MTTISLRYLTHFNTDFKAQWGGGCFNPQNSPTMLTFVHFVPPSMYCKVWGMKNETCSKID